MIRFNYIFLAFCFLSSCNTTNQAGYIDGVPIQLKIESEPNASQGECLADTLSFLVGQPETALAAMEYPANTRVLSEGQVVNLEDSNSSRLNLVIGTERKIVNVFCG